MPTWTPYTFTTEQTWNDAPRLQPDTVRKVLMVGDVHGEAWHLKKALRRAVELGVDAVVQVGDFWLADEHWHDHDPAEAKFMWLAHDSPVPIVLIDGNHEVWPTLARFAATPAAQAAFESRRPLHLGGSLWWAWRGSVWRWSTARFGALGGAVSPDREDRDVRRWRWPEETTTQDDLDRLVANVQADHDGQLDVLITHDAPAQVRGLVSSLDWAPLEVQRDCEATRQLLAEAVHRTRPRLLLHGHWHQSNREQLDGGTEVVGLANDGRADHLALLTLDDPLRCEYLPR